MEKTCNILFELSSGERMSVMQRLQKERLRLSQIAEELDMTVTETSRQLQRLSDAQLIHKDSGGLFSLTIFGGLVLQQLTGLGFITGNRQYFLEHDTSHLPYKFINRIGELSIGSFNKDVLACIAHAEHSLKLAEEYCWSLSDQVISSSSAIIEDKLKEGIKIRSILPETLELPTGYNPPLGVERRMLPSIDIRIMVTEKEAMFGLPFLNRQMDYTQIISRDPKFCEWCRDLYLLYWEKAKPILTFSNI